MAKNKGKEIGGLVMVGCMFLGAGIAWLAGVKFIIGGAIGMGVGFLAMAGIMAYYNRK